MPFADSVSGRLEKSKVAGGLALHVEYRSNGTWNQHSGYPEDQLEAAIAEAEGLVRSGDFDNLRIVRSEYRVRTDTQTNKVIWVPGASALTAAKPARRTSSAASMNLEPTAPGPKVRRTARSFNPSAEALSEFTAGASPARPGAVARPSGRQWHFARAKATALFVTVPLIILVSFGIVLVIGFVVPWFLNYLSQQGYDVPEVLKSNLEHMLQIAAFALSVPALAIRYLSPSDFGIARGPPKRKHLVSRAGLAALNVEPVSVSVPGGHASRVTPLSHPGDEASPAVPAAEDSVDDAEEPIEDFGRTPVESVQEKAVSETKRKDILKFLERALVTIQDAVPKLNNYVVFGLNLFIAGAGERFADSIGLTEKQKLVLIQEALEALGSKPEQVEVFCGKYYDYRVDSKYHTMVEAGGEAMDKFLTEEGDPFSGLSTVMKAWTSDSSAQAMTQGIVLIMFTDLVGSTRMTQEKGDYGAQEVVRTHNAIVRNALAEYTGHEVKHMGDGIMASFMSAISAVKATMMIQQELARNNAGAGNPEVNVRIGLNAGEAIREEEDYFGTAVQLAARVCDKADAGQIFVTASVRDLCQGHKFAFEKAGDYELKGIEGTVPLFNVAWQEGR